MENISEIVKQITIDELKKYNIEVKGFYLFGSRAKGTYREDSDWDFFVVIDKDLSFQKKWDIIDKIKIILAKLKIPNDIILKSEKEIQESKDDVGRITYYALKEGISI
jgi:predicted nucleotidyltransferase